MPAALVLASCAAFLYSANRWLGSLLAGDARLLLEDGLLPLLLLELLLVAPAGALLLLLIGSGPMLPLLWKVAKLLPAAAAADEVLCALFLRRLAADTAAQCVAASNALKPCSCTFSPAGSTARRCNEMSCASSGWPRLSAMKRHSMVTTLALTLRCALSLLLLEKNACTNTITQLPTAAAQTRALLWSVCKHTPCNQAADVNCQLVIRLSYSPL
jgi:hypothetical protein